MPWVARGAGSGLSGGALPRRGGRADRALAACGASSRSTSTTSASSWSRASRTSRSRTRSAPTHFYPPDPSSQIVCSIGGNVAENSGGAHCFKYGFTTNYVTGLDIVLPDGSLVHARRQGARPCRATTCSARSSARRARSAIATRITLRVVPKPEAVRTLVAFFELQEEAGEVVSRDRVRGHRAGRDGDDGQALDRGRRGRDWTPATRPTPARRSWWSWTARSPSARPASSR